MEAKFKERQKINCKLGDGIINMPELKKAADAQGVKAYIVAVSYTHLPCDWPPGAPDVRGFA